MTTDPHERPARFGPYFRRESPTQTSDDAARQLASGELWGRQPRGSAWPQVQALRGPLPENANGIEFYTDIPPDESMHPDLVVWSVRGRGGVPGVAIEGDFAKITCVVTLVRTTIREDSPQG